MFSSSFGLAESNLESQMKSEFALAFKKIAKKDEMTKKKGLQELKALIPSLVEKSNEETAVINRFIISWPSITGNKDYKVRVLSFEVLASITALYGKRITTILKSFIAQWILSFFDPSTEVQKIAKRVFNDTFPEAKHPTIFLHYHSDIMQVITNNLKITSTVLKQQGQTPEEEIEEKLARLHSTSILGLNHLLEHSPNLESPEAESARANYSKLIDARFCTLYQTTDIALKKSLYVLLNTICTQFPSLLTSRDDILPAMTAVILVFPRKDGFLTPRVWSGLIAFVKAFPQVFALETSGGKQQGNGKQQQAKAPESKLFTSFFNLLKQGCYDVEDNYLFILPFLSLIPAEITTSKWFDQFFAALWKGLSALELPRKKQRLAETYFECLTYATIAQRKSESTTEGEKLASSIAVHLIDAHYIPILKGYLSYKDSLVEGLSASLVDCVNKIALKDSCPDLIALVWSAFSALSDAAKDRGTFCEKALDVLERIAATGNQKLIGGGAQFLRNLVINIGAVKSEEQSLKLVSFVITRFGSDLFTATDMDIFTHSLFPCCKEAKSDNLPTQSLILEIACSFLHKLHSISKDCVQLTNSNVAHLCTLFEDDTILTYNLISQLLKCDMGSEINFVALYQRVAPVVTLVLALNEIPSSDCDLTNITIQHSILSETEIESALTKIQAQLSTAFDLSNPESLATRSLDRLNALLTLSHAYFVALGRLAEAKTFFASRLDLYSSLAGSILLHSSFSHDLSAHDSCVRSLAVSLGDILSAVDDEAFQRVFKRFSQDSIHRILNAQSPRSSSESGSRRLYDVASKCQHVKNSVRFVNGLLDEAANEVIATLDADGGLFLRALDIDYFKHGISPIAIVQLTEDLENSDENTKVLSVFIERVRLLAHLCKYYYSEHMTEDFRLDLVSHFMLFDFLFRQCVKPRWQQSLHLPKDDVRFVIDCLIASNFDCLVEPLTKNFSPLILDTQNKPESTLQLLALKSYFDFQVSYHRTNPETNLALDQYLGGIKSGFASIRKGVIDAILPQLFQLCRDPTSLTDFSHCFFNQLNAIASKEKTNLLDFEPIFTILIPILSNHKYNTSQSSLLIAIIGNFLNQSEKLFYQLDVGNQTAIFKLLTILLQDLSVDVPDASHLFWKNLQQAIEKRLVIKSNFSSLDASAQLLYGSAFRLLFAALARVPGLPVDLLLVALVKTFLTESQNNSAFHATLIEELALITPFVSEQHYNHLSPMLLESMLYKSLQQSQSSQVQFGSYSFLALLIKTANGKKHKDEAVKESAASDKEDQEAPVPISQFLKKYLDGLAEKDNKEVDERAERVLYYAWLLVLEYLDTPSQKEKSDIISFIRRIRARAVLDQIFYTLTIQTEPPTQPSNSLSVEELAAFVYHELVYKLPSIVRWWYNDLTSRTRKEEVQNYTTKYISPELIKDEMRYIQLFNKDPSAKIKSQAEVQYISNLTPERSTFSVKGYQGSQNAEVHATFEKDEVSACLVLTFSKHHPLSPVTLTSKHRMGVSESLWRKWMLSMTTLLLNQDGTVLDATVLWNTSLNKHFEGLELCPICYALFHVSNYSLPTLPCRTCNQKFHSSCLYEWFRTSHKNECPICRTAIG